MNMRRIRLLLEYDGIDFSGWQVQPDTRTVQGVLENALTEMMGSQVKVVGSGRTDAGVHALGQVAHADVIRNIPPSNIMMGLNSVLPPDVRVLNCAEASGDFHAQRNAVGKLYRYAILNRPSPTALDRNRVWHIRHTLDLEKMRQAAYVLIGRHDFAAFKSTGDDTTTVRHLRAIKIESERDHVWIDYEADGFLKHMVRNITGALIQVGLCKMEVSDIGHMLRERSRENAPRKAPAQGLTLIRVTY